MSRVLIISDIHANFVALESVLSAARSGEGYDDIWLLGDLVGRGPQPKECLAFLRDEVKSENWVLGNHDALFAEWVSYYDLLDETPRLEEGEQWLATPVGAIKRKILMNSRSEWEETNPVPIKAIIKNRAEVDTDEELVKFYKGQFIPENMKAKIKMDTGLCCVLVHANVADPIGPYIYPWETSLHIPNAIRELRTLVDGSQEVKSSAEVECVAQFFGHTHIPTLIEADGDEINSVMVEPEKEYQLRNGKVYMINPGSVGQPRDHDLRSSYAIFDTKKRSIQFFKVDYNRRTIADKLSENGYDITLVTGVSIQKMPSDTPAEWKRHFISVSEEK